ncbi:MAG: hypothetical protein LYZ69_09600 [Nitrososphaerales archaeon]|nr:hypothetical protein [Nitrososphaerales archaeon]
MNARRAAAGALGLADSVLGLYLGYTSPASSVFGALLMWLFWLSIVLLVDSLLCLYGVHYAFLVAGVLAVALAVDAPFALPSTLGPQLALVALSLLALAANILAFRSKSRLSEQGNPMNLPVFG